jgi:hypothetical protein
MNKTEMDRKVISTSTTRSHVIRFYLVFIIFAFCSLIFYFGEIINLAGWESLKNISFFFGVHDIHRLLFLAPIMYAGYYFGVRPAMIITILAIGVFIPRSLFFSPYPDPILRTVIFTIVAGLVGYLFAVTSTGYKKYRKSSRKPDFPKSAQP